MGWWGEGFMGRSAVKEGGGEAGAVLTLRGMGRGVRATLSHRWRQSLAASFSLQGGANFTPLLNPPCLTMLTLLPLGWRCAGPPPDPRPFCAHPLQRPLPGPANVCPTTSHNQGQGGSG